MQSRRTVLWALTALLVSSLPLSAGCKGDVPEGRIKPTKVELEVGETEHLELLVRTKFETVSRETWQVDPADLGEIYFNQAEPKRRKASFRGTRAGQGKIVVRGFYGDTKKPHRIAEVPVTVHEKAGAGDKSNDAGDKSNDAGDKSNDAGDKTNDAGDKTNDAGDKTNDAGDKTNDAGEESKVDDKGQK